MQQLSDSSEMNTTIVKIDSLCQKGFYAEAEKMAKLCVAQMSDNQLGLYLGYLFVCVCKHGRLPLLQFMGESVYLKNILTRSEILTGLELASANNEIVTVAWLTRYFRLQKTECSRAAGLAADNKHSVIVNWFSKMVDSVPAAPAMALQTVLQTDSQTDLRTDSQTDLQTDKV